MSRENEELSRLDYELKSSVILKENEKLKFRPTNAIIIEKEDEIERLHLKNNELSDKIVKLNSELKNYEEKML